MAETRQQVAAFLAVVTRGKAVETKTVDQQVRDVAGLCLAPDVAIELFIDDWNFIAGECAGIFIGLSE